MTNIELIYILFRRHELLAILTPGNKTVKMSNELCAFTTNLAFASMEITVEKDTIKPNMKVK